MQTSHAALPTLNLLSEEAFHMPMHGLPDPNPREALPVHSTLIKRQKQKLLKGSGILDVPTKLRFIPAPMFLHSVFMLSLMEIQSLYLALFYLQISP